MTKPHKTITATTLVLEALRKSDDFLDYAALRAATGLDTNHISAACIHLRKYRAVDVVVNPDGHAWWFALSPESDTRTYTVEERTPESKLRRTRKRKYRSILDIPPKGGK